MLKLIKEISRRLEASGFFLGSWLRGVLPIGDEAQCDEPLGLLGERVAAKYLKKLGYKVIAHSHRQKLGEIDLIAIEQGCIVFVEVKTWVSDSQADPSAAVDLIKQKKISRAALIYLKRHGLLDQPARFDVISIVWNGKPEMEPKIRHFKSAFEAVGKGQLYC